MATNNGAVARLSGFVVLMSVGLLGSCGDSRPSAVSELGSALAEAPSTSGEFPLSPPGERLFRTGLPTLELGSSASGYLLIAGVGSPWDAVRLSLTGEVLSTTPLPRELSRAVVTSVGEAWLVVYQGNIGVYSIVIDAEGQASSPLELTAGCACSDFTSLAWDGTRALLLLDGGRAVFLDAAGQIVGAPFFVADPDTFSVPGGTVCRGVAFDGTRYAATCTFNPSDSLLVPEVYAYPVSLSGEVGERVFLSEGLVRPGKRPLDIGIAAKTGEFLAVYSMPLSSGTAGNAYYRRLTASDQGLVPGPAQIVPERPLVPPAMTSDRVFGVVPTDAGYSILYEDTYGSCYSTQVANDGTRLRGQWLSMPSNLGSSTTDRVHALAAGTGAEILVNWGARAVVYDAFDLSPTAPAVTLFDSLPRQENLSVASAGSDYLAVWSEARAFADPYISYRTTAPYLEHVTLDGALVEASSSPLASASSVSNVAVSASGVDYAVVARGFADAVTGISIVRPDASITSVDVAGMTTLGYSQRYGSLSGDGQGGYLIAWFLEGGVGLNEFRAALISPAGVMSPSMELPVDVPYSRADGPFVSYDGEDYVVSLSLLDEVENTELVVLRVNRNLEVVAGPKALSGPTRARVACAEGNCLLAWNAVDDAATPLYALRALRIDRTLEVLDAAPISLASGPYDHSHAAIAWDGYRYWVTWIVRSQRGDFDLHGARVGADGAKQDLEPFLIANNVSLEQTASTVSMSSGRPGEALVAYTVPNTSDVTSRVRGRLLSARLPDGATCTEDAQCTSNACLDGRCTSGTGGSGGGGESAGGEAGSVIGVGGAFAGGEGGSETGVGGVFAGGEGGSEAGKGGVFTGGEGGNEAGVGGVSTGGEGGSETGAGGVSTGGGEAGAGSATGGQGGSDAGEGGNGVGGVAGAVASGGEGGDVNGNGGISGKGGSAGLGGGAGRGGSGGGGGGRPHRGGCTLSAPADARGNLLAVLFLAVAACWSRRRAQRARAVWGSLANLRRASEF